MSGFLEKNHSIRIMRTSMKLVGIWEAENVWHKRIMNCTLLYTVVAVMFALYILLVDLAYIWGNLYMMTENACALVPVVLATVKLMTFVYYRNYIKKLISFTQRHFWNADYDVYELSVLVDCDKTSTVFICTFTFFVGTTAMSFLFVPIIENWVRDGVDRTLPFRFYFNFPLYTTPYYEIAYTIQLLSTIHSAICVFCFDTLVIVLIVYTGGMLRILQHHIKGVIPKDFKGLQCAEIKDDGYEALLISKLRDCVNQHQTLILYVDMLETVFSVIMLGQLLCSSVQICLGVFQFLATTDEIRKLQYITHSTGFVFQLLMYTWSCNEIMLQSQNVAEACFVIHWYLLPYRGVYKSFRQQLLFIMLRSGEPLRLTAGKFVTMSLHTFGKVLSTAVSYFTLLRQLTEEPA